MLLHYWRVRSVAGLTSAGAAYAELEDNGMDGRRAVKEWPAEKKKTCTYVPRMLGYVDWNGGGGGWTLRVPGSLDDGRTKLVGT
jgi:hypothetical protein